MTKLFLFTLSLLFVVQLARNQDCHGSQFRIRNRVNNSVLADDGTGTLDSVYGILDICFNNTYTSVCNTTNVNTSEVARIACQNLGYDYDSDVFISNGLNNASTIIGSIDCPNDASDFDSCLLGVTNATECDYEDQVYVRCTRYIPLCVNGEVRLNSNSSNSNNDGDTYLMQLSGNVEICYNGKFYGLCTSGNYNFQRTAELTCLTLSYKNETSYSKIGYNNDQAGSDGINDVSCPANATSLSQCSFTISNSSDTSCRSNFSDLSITCSNRFPSCGYDFFRFGDQSSFSFSNNTQVRTGRVEVCLNGSYVPVCRNAISYDDLDSVCAEAQSSGYITLPDQYIGNFSDYQTGSSAVRVQSISCPSDAENIVLCQYSTSIGCSSFEEVLTCIYYYKECSGTGFRTRNSIEVILPYESNSETFRVEVCRDGYYVDVCNNTEHAQYFAEQACGNSYKASIVAYDSEFSTAKSGRSLIIDGECTDIKDNGYGSCNNLTDYDTSCSSSSSPLVVQCERECREFGYVRLVQTNTTNYDNGTTGLSGILQFCNKFEWNTVCDNNLTDFDTVAFCSQFSSYTSGYLLPSNPGGNLNEPNKFVNLSCPSYKYHSPTFCSVESQNEGTFCNMPVNLYCYNDGNTDNCFEGEVRFGSNYNQITYGFGHFSNGTRFQVSYAEVCINGSFRVLCNQDLFDEDVSALCLQSSLYFKYGYPRPVYGSGYLLPTTSSGIYNITCPAGEDRFNTYSCSYSTTDDFNGCDAYGGAALVTCVDVEEEPSCENELAEQGYGRFSNGTSFYVGRPRVCVDGSNVPICGTLSQEEAVLFCYNVQRYYGALTSPVFGSVSDYGNDDEATTVVTDLTCPADQFYEFNLLNCNLNDANSNNGCLSYEPQPVITCYFASRPCKDSTLATDYVGSTATDFYTVLFYTLRYCQSGFQSRVCKNGVTNQEAAFLCQEKGRTHGYVSEDHNNYTSSVSTSKSLSNFRCLDNSLSNCSYDVVDSCSESGGDLVIGCYNDRCISEGKFRLSSQYKIPPSADIPYEGVGGVIEICINGRYTTVCANNSFSSVDSEVLGRLICSQLGYPSDGLWLLSPGLSMSSETSVINSLECPAQVTDLSSCSFNTSSSGNCVSHNYDANLQCFNTSISLLPKCYDGQVRLAHNTTGNSMEYEEISGTLEICVDGSYERVCGNDDSSLNASMLVETACNDIGYGAGSSYSLSNATSPSINYVSCPSFLFSLIQCNFSTTDNGSCVDQNVMSNIFITCTKEKCSYDGQIRLTNQYKIPQSEDTPYEGVGGVIEICINQSYTSICANDSFSSVDTETLSRLTCSQLGYPSEGLMFLFPGFSTSTEPSVINSLSCPAQVTDLKYCSFSTTNSGECSSHDYDANIQCYNSTIPLIPECFIDGQVRLVHNTTSNSTEYEEISGTLEICVDGSYERVCGNDDASLNASMLVETACNDIGYGAGSYYSLYNATSPSINHVSCPSLLFSLIQCNFSTTDNSSCVDKNVMSNIFITCRREKCSYDGQIRLTNQYKIPQSEDTPYEGVGGVIEICINQSYTSICANDSFSSVDTETLSRLTCSQLGYPSEGLMFLFPGFSTSTESSVISSLSCPPQATNLSSCSFGTTSSGECSSHEYDANIQCFNSISVSECIIDGQVRIAHNTSESFAEYEEITGILEICVDGSYERVCGNEDASLNATLLVETACNDIGYRAGSSYSLSNATSPINYASCPEYFLFSLIQCNFSTTDNGSCVDQNVMSNIFITCRRDLEPPPCSDGDVRLQSNYTNSLRYDDSFVMQISGNLEICYNGTFRGLCASGDYNFQQTAELACLSFGYTNDTSYTTYGYNADQAGSDGINDVSCPVNATSLSQCSFTLSNSSDTNCRSHFSDLSVTCSNRFPYCGSKLFRLVNESSFFFANKTQVYTGRVEVCLNQSYVPVCSDAIGYDDLDSICKAEHSTSYVALPDQYIGDFSDYQTGATSATVQFASCPSNAGIISQCQYNISYGCSSSEEVLTCIDRSASETRECFGTEAGVGNNTYITLPYGSGSRTGRVQVCRDGEFVDVCNNTEHAQYFAEWACGSYNQATLIAYESEFSTATSGQSLIIDGECSDIEMDGFEHCSNLSDFDTPCESGNSPLVVQCERDCPGFGSVRLVQTNTSNYDNGTTGVSGVLQFCNNNEWNTVCDNNLTDFDTDRFCAQFGYNNGSLLFSNPGGDLNDFYRFVNLSCPSGYSYSPSSCSVEHQDEETFCNVPANLYCYNGGKPNRCYNGQVRIGSNYNQITYGFGQFSNGTRFRISYAEVCINGSFHVLCNQDLSKEDISALCQSSVGYRSGYPRALYGSISDYLLPTTSSGIYNITCPAGEDRFNTYSCSYSTTDDFNGCDAYGGAALVTCVDVMHESGEPSCSSYDLAERGYGTFFNGTSFSVGHPQACVNGSRAPICGSLNQEEAVLLCTNIQGYYGALTSPVFGSVSDYGTAAEATTVVTDLSCPADQFYEFNLFNCNLTDVKSNNGCLSYEPQPVITCYSAPRPCQESSLQLNPIDSTYTEYYIAFYSVRYCQSNTLSTVCSDGITDEEAALFCQQDGYTRGYVSEDHENYTSSTLTSESLSNFRCLNSSFSNCSYDDVDSCSESGGELVIGCYNEPPLCIPGQITLLDLNSTYQPNSSFYIIGYPALCINNSYVPICNSADLSIVEARVICAYSTEYEYGFTGYPVSFNPSALVTYNGTKVVTSLMCNIEGNCINRTATRNESCDNFAAVTCGLVCRENSTQLYNQRLTLTPEGLFRVSGVPLSCSDGGWVGICNDGTNDPDLPEIICQQEFGYKYGVLLSLNETSSFRPIPQGTLYVNNFVCPDEEPFNYLEECNFNLTYTEECLSGSQIYAIQCFDYRECVEGQIQLADSQRVTTDEGIEYISGYPVICVDTEYVPVCNSSSIGLREVAVLCSAAENITNGFVGTSNFLNLSSFSDVNTSVIVNDFTCNTDYECENTSVSTVAGCSAYGGGFTAITCANVCEDGDTRVYDERIFYTDDGLLRVTGIPQRCENKGWISVCNDGTIDPVFPILVCQNSGLRGGSLLSSNHALYGTSPPGSLYAVNITCPDEDLENCDGDIDYSKECVSGDLEYVVECYNFQNCYPGEIRLSDVSNYTSSEGFYYTSGYPVLCVNDQLVPLCNNTMLGLLEVSYICALSSNLTYGFSGTPGFLTVSPFSNENVTSVVTSFDCSLKICNNMTTQSASGCGTNGGYAVVTCANACTEGDLRLYNTMTTLTSDGLSRYTGIPQQCLNGGWNSLCTIGTIDDNIPSLVCKELGYIFGETIPFNRAVYGISPPGTFYYTDIDCTETIILKMCSKNETFAAQCLNGTLEYTLQCYNIKEVVSLTQEPQNVTLVQTASAIASFTCQFSGDPRPSSVSWQYVPVTHFGSTVLISSGGQYSIDTTAINGNTTASTLTISSVTLFNGGVYLCFGNNGGPPATGRSLLSVIVAPNITLTVSGPTNPTEGETFTFTCAEDGSFPALSVIWFKDGSLVSSSSRVSIQPPIPTQNQLTLLYTVQSILTINSVLVSDSGSFECRTTAIPNILDPIVSTAIALDVQVRNECIIEAPANRPSPCVNGYCIDGINDYFCQCFDGFTGPNCDQTVTTTSPPIFVRQPSEESVLLGDTANFSCIVLGEPKPAISWMKNGIILTGEVFSYLIIPSVGTANRGFYTCQATNSEGTITSEEALLRIQNVAQYASTLTQNSAHRRRRQSMVFESLLINAREVAVGREVAPGKEIVALDGHSVNNGFKVVFTVRAPVTDSGRPDTSGVESGLNDLIDEVSQQYPTLSFSPVMRFDGCLPTSTTLFGNVTLDWPEIGAGENATLPCPCGTIADTTGLTATRMCQGDFVSLSEWISPDTKKCQYNNKSQELCNAATTANPTKGAQVLVEVTAESSTLTVTTFGIATAFLKDLAKNENLTREIADDLFDVINNLFDVDQSVLRSDTEASTRILESIDLLTQNIPLTDGKASIIRPRIAIIAQEISAENFTGLSFGVALNNNGNLDGNSLSGNGELTGSIDVPRNLLDGIQIHGLAKCGFGTFTDDNFFIQSSTETVVKQPVSIIMSLEVFSTEGDVKIMDLENPVSLSFVLSNSMQNSNLKCAFWEHVTSTWSYKGCQRSTTSNTGNTVLCQCDHLSSFTVVEEQSVVPSPSPDVAPPTQAPVTEEYYTEPIIIVGCAVSIPILLIAVISHIISPTHRTSHEGKTLICSHISLIVLYIITIIAAIASYTDNEEFCGTLSGLFHYASLVYVMWLFSEGYIYVVTLRCNLKGMPVFRHLFSIMFILTLGIPLLIIIISVASGYNYYAQDNAFCRPQSYPFYFGYIIPVVVIFIAANLCLVVGCLMKGAEASYLRQLLAPHLFAASIINLIVLITWIFGLFGTDYNILGAASIATQYIFGIFLMIHAVLVLVMTMLRTKDTRQACSGCLNRITGRSSKYDFAEEAMHQKSTTSHKEVINLGSSGQLSSKDINEVDRISPDSEERQVDTTFSSKSEEKRVRDEEEKKYQKEAEIRKMSEKTVIANQSAIEDPDIG